MRRGVHRGLLRALVSTPSPYGRGREFAQLNPAKIGRSVIHRTAADRGHPWAVLATDGAYNTMQQVALPSATQLPRAKRHDDKSPAVARFTG